MEGKNNGERDKQKTKRTIEGSGRISGSEAPDVIDTRHS